MGKDHTKKSIVFNRVSNLMHGCPVVLVIDIKHYLVFHSCLLYCFVGMKHGHSIKSE